MSVCRLVKNLCVATADYSDEADESIAPAVILILVITALPFLIATPMLRIAHPLVGRPFNLGAFIVRLWTIVGCLALAIAANAALLWIEA
jgi:hypothetical protein